jgi:hypothetical protein
MEATMNLNEHRRIGGSVYRATINGLDLAVKKTKEDVCTEVCPLLWVGGWRQRHSMGWFEIFSFFVFF